MNGASPDVVDVLLGHHQQIKLLFGQLDQSTGEHKQQLFTDLVALLAVHESLEQLLVHPLAAEQVPDGDKIVDARLAEELDAKEALGRLYDLGVGNLTFDQELFTLRDAVAAHAAAEEEQEFAQLREVTDPQHLQRMAAFAQTAAMLLPTSSNGDSPSGASAVVLVGPPLTVFDQARQALQGAVGTEGTAQ